MKVVKSESGSDVSSDSSWTVIEEIQETILTGTKNDQNPNLNSDREIESTELNRNDVNEDFVKVRISEASVEQSSDEYDSLKNENRENGFLTFDEYLQERMLEHDYGFPNQSIIGKKISRKKKFLKKRSKCKAETISILSICASLLTVTGISLLCLIFPENIDNKNFDIIKSNSQAIANNRSLDYSTIVSSFNKTMEVLEATNNSRLLSKCVESISSRPEYKYKLFKTTLGPMNEIASSRYRWNKRRRGSISFPNILRNDVCFPKSNNGVCYANEDPRLFPNPKNEKSKSLRLQKPKEYNTKLNFTENSHNNTSLTTIESVLASTSLKKIIRSIIHDICVLKLITYINKKKEMNDSKQKKSGKGEQKASKRKLFEVITDGMESLSYDDDQVKGAKTAKKKNEVKKQIVKQKKLLTSNSLIGTTRTSLANSQQNSCQVVKSYPPMKNLICKFENGKSECERKFEELDSQRKKSQEVCSKHRINIQQIKQQYKNEMNAIKESNVDPSIRFHRIQTLREKYRMQLKKNREIYMREMSKMKRLRSKMLKDLCARKKIELEMKDASVGSYVVPIDQDFQSRLQQMRLKENFFPLIEFKHQGQNSQEKTEQAFKLPSCPNNELEEPYIHSPVAIRKDMLNENMYYAQGSKKPYQPEKPTSIPEVYYLFLDSEENRLRSQSLDCQPPEQNNCFESQNQQNQKFSDNSEDNEDKISENKKIQDHLYQVAFEKKGPFIENADNLKWHHRRYEFWRKYRKYSNKQDPQKCFKTNVMLYKPGKL